MPTEEICTIALTRVDGIGGVLFRHLVNTFGSASQVFSARKEKLLKVPGLGKILTENILHQEKVFTEAEDILNNSVKAGVKVVSFKDEDYPARFKNLYDAPPLMYVKGNGSLHHKRTVGIVGTRQASDYGRQATESIVAALQPFDVQIISGLAYGIDISAHRAALKNQMSTIGVLANGLDIIYPSSHKKSAVEMLGNGLLISENPVGTLPVASLFLARNRIIAALSDVLIIVESGKRGGAMVTAEIANNYHREVFAVPGSIFHKYAEGTNGLIQSNKAIVFTGVDQLAENMQWLGGKENCSGQAGRELDMSLFTEDESAVISILMQKKECLIDDLSWQSQIPLNRLASVLLNLEFMDIVSQSAGKTFRLK